MASILKVNTIQDATNSNTAMSIDSSGRVSLPLVPAFRVGLASTQTITTADSNETVTWDDGTSSDSINCFTQGGFSWSSGIVTVPISGVYQFDMTLRIDGIGSGYVIGKIVKNNVHTGNDEYYTIEGSPASDYQAVTTGGVFKCSASDTIKATVYAESDSSFTVDHGGSIFSGHLIG